VANCLAPLAKVINDEFGLKEGLVTHIFSLISPSLLFVSQYSYVYAALIFSVASFLASGIGLVMLMACPAFMIKAGLIFSIIVMIAAVAVGFYLGNIIYGILASVFLLLTICYVKVVWRRGEQALTPILEWEEGRCLCVCSHTNLLTPFHLICSKN